MLVSTAINKCLDIAKSRNFPADSDEMRAIRTVDDWLNYKVELDEISVGLYYYKRACWPDSEWKKRNIFYMEAGYRVGLWMSHGDTGRSFPTFLRDLPDDALLKPRKVHADS
jgi:hypothetical protein